MARKPDTAAAGTRASGVNICSLRQPLPDSRSVCIISGVSSRLARVGHPGEAEAFWGRWWRPTATSLGDNRAPSLPPPWPVTKSPWCWRHRTLSALGCAAPPCFHFTEVREVVLTACLSAVRRAASTPDGNILRQGCCWPQLLDLSFEELARRRGVAGSRRMHFRKLFFMGYSRITPRPRLRSSQCWTLPPKGPPRWRL